jgi:hypothetical protein
MDVASGAKSNAFLGKPDMRLSVAAEMLGYRRGQLGTHVFRQILTDVESFRGNVNLHHGRP